MQDPDSSNLLRWYRIASGFDPRPAASVSFRDPTRVLRYARRAMREIRRYAPMLESTRGTRLRRPFQSYWRLFRRFGHSVEEFYRYRLHDAGCDLEAARFLSEHRTAMFNRIGTNHLGVDIGKMWDKSRFADLCHGHGLPVIPTIAVVEHDRVRWGPGRGAEGLLATDLFTKPVRGCLGQGVSRWNWCSGAYVNASGERFSADALLDRLRDEAQGGSILVQPMIQNSGPLSQLGLDGLSTLRVLTSRRFDGSPELQRSVLRMPTGSSLVDNFAAKGIAAPVEIGSGEVGAAVFKAVEGAIRGESFSRHPDTGQRIAGLRLPAWSEVSDLCLRAHRWFPEFHTVGWDVVITTEGPQLLEGNHNPDPVVSQQPGLAPLGSTQIVENAISFFREQP